MENLARGVADRRRRLRRHGRGGDARRARRPVTVFEPGRCPAAARAVAFVRRQGHELDNGQHILIGAYTELFRLMRTVGVPSDALLRIPLEIRYARGFQPARALASRAARARRPGSLLANGIPFTERLGAVQLHGAR